MNLLRQLVAIRSSYPDEEEISIFLIRHLRAIGFRVETQTVARGRTNILAAKGCGKRSVLFYGHMDTVPLTNRSGWHTDPCTLTQKGNRLYGLGAYDMKGGMSAFLSACEGTSAYVKVFLAVDEENISEGAWKAVNGRKAFFRDVSLIISAEPNFELGLHGITTGRTGRCVFDVKFVGVPAHLAAYTAGKDAIGMLAKFVSRLYRERGTMFAGTRTVLQVRKITGESVGMIVCGEASLEVEVLLDAKTSVAAVRRVLLGFGATQVSLKERNTPYLTGYQFDQFPNMRDIGKIIQQATGRSMRVHTRTSVGDDNVLATLGIPVITWGPDGGNAHAPDEYVLRRSISALTGMYKKLLKCL